jgi:ABC-type Fe3+/spermidine/putrescine transport system ATPase subunit
MLTKLLEQDHRQQIGATEAARRHMERRRRLGDRLAFGHNARTGVIEDATFLGAILRLRVRIDGTAPLVDAFNSNGASFPEPGDEVKVSFSPNDLIVLDNR